MSEDDGPIPRREFNAFSRLMDERKEALRDALDKAEKNVEGRFEQVNRLREQINNERGRFVTFDKYDQAHNDLSRRINDVEKFAANETGRHLGIGAAIIILTVIINAVGVFIGFHR